VHEQSLEFLSLRLDVLVFLPQGYGHIPKWLGCRPTYNQFHRYPLVLAVFLTPSRWFATLNSSLSLIFIWWFSTTSHRLCSL
jgi:hypothetical protein